MKPLLVTLAPTGMVPTLDTTPHVPVTPAAIVRDVLDCAAAGVSSVHLHARGGDGRPTWEPGVYARIIEGIRTARPDLILTVSTSGRTFGAFEQRSAVLGLTADLRPDMASLTLGSLNFADGPSVNAPDMVFRLAETMRERGIKAELEIFDLGMVNVLRRLIDKGLVEPPYCINLLLGNIATAQPSLLHLGALVSDLPQPCVVTLAGLGRYQTMVASLAAAMTDGVRIGLEDNIWFDAQRTRLSTNLDQVRRVAAMADLQERPLANPVTARQMLGLVSR